MKKAKETVKRIWQEPITRPLPQVEKLKPHQLLMLASYLEEITPAISDSMSGIPWAVHTLRELAKRNLMYKEQA